MSALKVIEASIYTHTPWVHGLQLSPTIPTWAFFKNLIRILIYNALVYYNSPHNWVKTIPEKNPFREPFFHCLVELPVLCRMIIVGLGDLFWGWPPEMANGPNSQFTPERPLLCLECFFVSFFHMRFRFPPAPTKKHQKTVQRCFQICSLTHLMLSRFGKVGTPAYQAKQSQHVTIRCPVWITPCLRTVEGFGLNEGT